MPSGEWLKPFFVPPTSEKAQYEHWFHRATVTALHRLLPGTDRFVLAGYSVPAADIAHLHRLFVPQVIDRDARVSVVNPDRDEGLRERVARMFPTAAGIDYPVSDFREWCRSLMTEDERKATQLATERGS